MTTSSASATRMGFSPAPPCRVPGGLDTVKFLVGDLRAPVGGRLAAGIFGDGEVGHEARGAAPCRPRPTPSVTKIVWPRGWMCQAVRAGLSAALASACAGPSPRDSRLARSKLVNLARESEQRVLRVSEHPLEAAHRVGIRLAGLQAVELVLAEPVPREQFPDLGL
jgi:hypothetical protein